MKQIFICLLFLFVFLKPAHSYDAKFKTLAVTSAYGAVGGLLLGTASLAFGTSGRSVAKGASLGLYAGILFGTYVIVSHQMKSGGWQQYNNFQDDSSSPYDNTNYYEMGAPQAKNSSRGSGQRPDFYTNLINYSF